MRILSLLIPPLTLALAPDLAAQATGVRQLRLGVLPGLNYDTPRFAVEPGQQIELRFVNDDEMPHNFVLTNPGQRMAITNAALGLGADGPKLGWVPKSDDVLQAISELAPGKEQTLKFRAPTTAGAYPYVCTYPGHGFLMFGVMYVGTKMPVKLADDPNVSPAWQTGQLKPAEQPHDHAHQHQPPEQPTAAVKPSLHAWSADRRPLVYRLFMPDCSPAAFAVALPGRVSYCWDATSCRLRYAWHGDFVDPMPVWKGNGNGLAKILGERFATAEGRLFTARGLEGDDAPKPEFLGYRMREGRPEFRYRIGDYEIFEKITEISAADLPGERSGLRVAFTVRPANDATPSRATRSVRPAARITGAVEVEEELDETSAEGSSSWVLNLIPTEQKQPTPAAKEGKR